MASVRPYGSTATDRPVLAARSRVTPFSIGSKDRHAQVKIFDGGPIVHRQQQQIRLLLAGLTHEPRIVSVRADGGGHASVRRVARRQASITRTTTERGFPAWHQPALVIGEIDAAVRVEQHRLVLERALGAQLNGRHSHEKVDVLLAREPLRAFARIPVRPL